MAVAATAGTYPPNHFNPSNRQELLSMKLSAAVPFLLSGFRLTVPTLAQFPAARRSSAVIAGDRFRARASSSTEEIPAGTVKIIAVAGEGSISPLKGVTWEEVMLHTAERLKWVDEGFQMLVFTDRDIPSNNATSEALGKELAECDILVSVALHAPASLDWLQANIQSTATTICFEPSQALADKLGGSFIQSAGQSLLFKSADSAKLRNGTRPIEVVKTVAEAWARYNSDDIRFCLLLIIDHCIKPVPILKNLRAKGLPTVSCMLKNCGAEMLNCLLDPNCRKALRCLDECSPTDQVCNYRCIASYESSSLTAFSLCVLQKHNCLALDAEIPSKPAVPPLPAFREEALNHETAEDLFVGWLGHSEWSWRVAAGQNPAYDQFPCQYQLFYRGKAKGSFWYEPIFRVRTLEEGRLVWRRRRYRVRRAGIPGTFHFSAMDNGVVSKEFWTIVDVGNDLSWGLFHYSGAAGAAGISYSGAVLVSPDGMYPRGDGGEKLAAAMKRCRMKEWELYSVDNCSCFNPPLGIPEGSGLHQTVDVKDERWA